MKLGQVSPLSPDEVRAFARIFFCGPPGSTTPEDPSDLLVAAPEDEITRLFATALQELRTDRDGGTKAADVFFE